MILPRPLAHHKIELPKCLANDYIVNRYEYYYYRKILYILQITNSDNIEEEGLWGCRYTCETGKQHNNKPVADTPQPGSDITAINDPGLRKKRRGSNFH